MRFSATGMLLAWVMLVCSFAGMRAGTVADSAAQVDLRPRINGAIRARYEYATQGGEERFQVRNARLTIAGDLAPAIDYYIQADLYDRGDMKILGAWGQLELAKGLKLRGGQFRLPMGTDCFRGPATYIFANRSFLVRRMNNVRGVGAMLACSGAFAGGSWGLDCGAFNPTSITDQKRWVKELAYAAKGRVTVGNTTVEAGWETLCPDLVRINLAGASVNCRLGGLTLEGEYLYKHDTHGAHKAAHGWQVFGNYAFPVKRGMFNSASVQARYDGITAHSDGITDDSDRLVTNFDACNRITAGGTVTYSYKRVHCDIRLSYEKFFYHKDHMRGNPDAEDKICAELVVRF